MSQVNMHVTDSIYMTDFMGFLMAVMFKGARAVPSFACKGAIDQSVFMFWSVYAFGGAC